MPDGPRSIIVSDGGLPALIACSAAAQDPAANSAILPVIWDSGDPDQRIIAACRQAELTSIPLAGFTIPTTEGAPVGAVQTLSLVRAALAAAGANIPRVIWPIHAGPGAEPDLETLARIIDRALLVSRLVALDAHDHACPAIRVETPYADFTDTQMAELALDLGAPIHACWWWGGQGGSAAAERQRWMAALGACGWVPA